MSVDLTSLRLTKNRDNMFTRGFWNTFLTKLGTLLTNQVKPYKVYTALLTQTGTNAPTAIVLENTLGGEPVFSYDNIGTYILTLNNTFTENKTVVFTQQFVQLTNYDLFQAYRQDNNSINLQTTKTTIDTPSNNMLNNYAIEIRVYN